MKLKHGGYRPGAGRRPTGLRLNSGETCLVQVVDHGRPMLFGQTSIREATITIEGHHWISLLLAFDSEVIRIYLDREVP